MSDISITDLIARLRYQYTSSNPLANFDIALVMGMAADALESVNREMLARELHHFEAEEMLAAAKLDVQRAEDRANNLAGNVASLGAVTESGLCAGCGERVHLEVAGAEMGVLSGASIWEHDVRVPDLLKDHDATVESVTVPTKPPVHNHGPAEGRGLDCNESVVSGFLQGACMRATEQTDRFSQSPHMASKYWAELVRARNRVAEVEEELAEMSALAQVNAMNVSDYLDAIEDAKQVRAELASVQQPNPEAVTATNDLELEALLVKWDDTERPDGWNSGDEHHLADLLITALRSASQPVNVEVTDEKAMKIALLIRNEFYLPSARVEVLDEEEREALLPIARAALEAALGGVPEDELPVPEVFPGTHDSLNALNVSPRKGWLDGKGF